MKYFDILMSLHGEDFNKFIDIGTTSANNSNKNVIYCLNGRELIIDPVWHMCASFSELFLVTSLQMENDSLECLLWFTMYDTLVSVRNPTLLLCIFYVHRLCIIKHHFINR